MQGPAAKQCLTNTGKQSLSLRAPVAGPLLRALLLCFGIAAVTWLEYQFFPGHTYLEGDTQTYLPMMERLDAPGFLSRDLVATHPNVRYTIYDELTLFLHEAGHLDFHTALVAQQLVCRAAAILGIFLLAIAAGAGEIFAFALAAIVNLGATLTGPGVSFVDPEPVPRTFAFGLLLLAASLLAREKPLLAGFAGGIAAIYDPAIAAPFWIVLLLAFAFDGRLRHLLRPALPVLLVFVLLLANLAQLQPGITEPEHFFSKIPSPFAALIEYRTKFVWVSLWAHEMWNFGAIFVCGLWATARIWPVLKRQARWFFLGLPLCGLLSVPFSYILLEHLRWAVIPRIQPARALLYTVVFASVACGIASIRAAQSRRRIEACLWFLVVIALPLNVRVLDFFGHGFAPFTHRAGFDHASVRELANWAENQTWGSSMFLFADAGRGLYPGMFRAESRRAVWVDWNSGRLVPYSESFAAEWWQRWQDTMEDGFSPQRLEELLPLPVDYFVLRRGNALRDVRPVFRNAEFVAYDAQDLREAKKPLRLLHTGSR